jgi:hypothetical protein
MNNLSNTAALNAHVGARRPASATIWSAQPRRPGIVQPFSGRRSMLGNLIGELESTLIAVVLFGQAAVLISVLGIAAVVIA